MSISRRKNSHKKTHVRNHLKPMVLAVCSLCLAEARIQQSHVGRHHKDCPQAPRTRAYVDVPGYAYGIRGDLLHRPLPDGQPTRIIRRQLFGSPPSKSGKWEG